MKFTEEEAIGKGATTLDYLRVRYEWLGELIDEAEQTREKLESENEVLRTSVRDALKILLETDCEYDDFQQLVSLLRNAIKEAGIIDE